MVKNYKIELLGRHINNVQSGRKKKVINFIEEQDTMEVCTNKVSLLKRYNGQHYHFQSFACYESGFVV